MIPYCTMQNQSAVGTFCRDDIGCYIAARRFGISHSVLASSQKYITAYRPVDRSEKAPIFSEKGNAYTLLSTKSQQGWRTEHVPETNNARDHVNRNLKHLFLLLLDDNRLAIPMHI
jgi:hypothetical protein